MHSTLSSIVAANGSQLNRLLRRFHAQMPCCSPNRSVHSNRNPKSALMSEACSTCDAQDKKRKREDYIFWRQLRSNFTLGCPGTQCWTTMSQSKSAGTCQAACLTAVSIADSASRAALKYQACKVVVRSQTLLNSTRRAVTQCMYACSGICWMSRV